MYKATAINAFSKVTLYLRTVSYTVIAQLRHTLGIKILPNPLLCLSKRMRVTIRCLWQMLQGCRRVAGASQVGDRCVRAGLADACRRDSTALKLLRPKKIGRLTPSLHASLKCSMAAKPSQVKQDMCQVGASINYAKQAKINYYYQKKYIK